MHLHLLGTGAADGWPNPWCSCGSCRWARATPGAARSQTCLVIDGNLLVDSGSARGGTADLSRVQTLLLTHAHPDHAAPQLLLWRTWASRSSGRHSLGPLEVAGPPVALAAMRDAAGPDVVWQQLSPGDVVTLASGHRVRALAANHDPDTGPPLLYDISAESTGSGGVLVAWDTAAPLPPDAARPASGAGPHGPYDAVLLECTAGNEAPADGHHDLAGFARTVTALRRDGAIAPTTRVVAVHLGHANPPGPELAARLAQLGAEAVSDGTELRLGPAGTGPSAAPGPSRVLVTGGTRSGKSAEAERRVTGRDVTYVATSLPRPGDADWAARVAIHRSRRPADWRTVETLDVAGLLRTALPSDTLLVDCMSLWLAARMDSADLAAEVDDLIAAWRETDATVVLVTSEVGSAVHAPTREGRAYADALGSLNGRLAAESDETWLVVAGCPLRLR